MYRLITDAEKLVRQMAAHLPIEESRSILSDLSNATLEEANEDGMIVSFSLQGYSHPKLDGQRAYNVEGSVQDKDGSQLNLALFSDANGRLLELELIRYDEGPVIEPDWTTLRLY